MIVLGVGGFVLQGWVVALAARAVGSKRGRLGVGIVAGLICFLLNGAFAAAGMLLVRPHMAAATHAMGWALLGWVLLVWGMVAVEWAAMLAVMRYAFSLSLVRALAPLGAMAGLAVAGFVLAILVVRPHLIEAFVMVQSTSMSPTIDPGDRLLVNKMERPRRLDVVLYHSQDRNRTVYCKRVIALPGERLRFENGNVYINNQPIALPSVIAGKCHAFAARAPLNWRRYVDGQTIALGPAQYFVLGDNLDVSVDSRMTGPLAAGSLVGVVDLRYWPLGRWHILR